MPKLTRVCAPRTGDGIAHPRLLEGRIQKGLPKNFCVYRNNFLLVSAATLAFFQYSFATPLSSADFAVLAKHCAPELSPSILRAVANTESGLDPWALYDDTTGHKEEPVSQVQAQSDAMQWLQRGDSVDIGLMQINSVNFLALGLSVQTALDPCTSLAAGAAVLRAAYGGGNTPAEQQVALLMALSRYNTGSPLRGIMNGYARTVLANVNPSAPVNSAGNNKVNSMFDPNMPPNWNVAESGIYAEVHGAPWLIAFSSDTSSTSSAR